MPIFTSDLTSRGIIYADTITTNSNEDLTLNPAGTGAVVANARLKVNEISADDSSAVSIKSPLQLDSTLQVVGTSVLVGNVTMSGTFTSTTGSSVGNLTLADGSITDSSGTITFNDENLTTTGNITAGNITGADIQSTGTVYTDTIASVASNENITLSPQGTGAVITTNIQLNQIAANDSSAVSITSPLQTGNIQSSGDITANDLELSGNIDLTSNGTITIGSGDSTADLTLTHDGTDVYLTKAGTSGEVYVRGRNISLQNDDGTQTFVTAGHGGATELYHGGLGSPGLITTVSGGISIPNGTLLVNTIASGDSTSVRINDSIETDGLTVNGTVAISGNLTVSGTTTYVDTTNLTVSDPLVILSKGNSGGSDVDSGIMVERGSAGNNAVFYWNEGEDKFKAVTSTSGHDATSITDTATATIVADLEGDVTASTITVNEISSSDSTAIQINDGVNISGILSANTIDTNVISSSDSTAIQIEDSINLGSNTITANTGSFVNFTLSDTLTIGSQIIYAQGTNGFSVNEDFDPSNSSTQTAYHYTTGAGRETLAFTLARTGQFTDGFGIYGTSADNTFVTFGEQSNTSFEWRRGVGIQPLDLDGGTLMMRLSSAGDLTINNDIIVQGSVIADTITTSGSNNDINISANGTGRVIVESLQVSGNVITATDSTQIGFGQQQLTDVADPTQASDVATKSYVDTQVSGIESGVSAGFAIAMSIAL